MTEPNPEPSGDVGVQFARFVPHGVPEVTPHPDGGGGNSGGSDENGSGGVALNSEEDAGEMAQQHRRVILCNGVQYRVLFRPAGGATGTALGTLQPSGRP